MSVTASRDRLHIQLGEENGENIIPRLEKIFGIQSFSPVVKVAQDMDEICSAGLALVQKASRRARRSKFLHGERIKSFHWIRMN